MISVVIPSYNSHSTIKECIRALLNQNVKVNYEIIVVDNASSDGSLELAKKILSKSNKKYILIKNSSNVGYCLGNNIGIKHSKGEYIAIINPDIILEKDWLKKLIEVLELDNKIAMCQGKILYYGTKIINSTGNLMDRFGAVKCRGTILTSFFP